MFVLVHSFLYLISKLSGIIVLHGLRTSIKQYIVHTMNTDPFVPKVQVVKEETGLCAR